MKKHFLAGLGVFVLTSSSGHAQTLNIDHQAVGCAVAEKFPRLEARFSPPDIVAKARVVFQGENTQEWYAVVMKPEGGAFAGVLPKPKKSLKAFRYYIEVTDKALDVNRTAEYTTNVVDSSSACKGKIMAGTLGSASVVLQGPAGAAVLPAGFASNGVVAAGSAAGSSTGSATGAAGATAAAGAGAAAAAGGGLSGGALIGIVAGVGAAAAGVAVTAGKGGDNSSPSGSSPTPTPTPSTSYTGPFAGQRTIQQVHVSGPGGCASITSTLSGIIRVTLDSSSNGTGNITGTHTVVSVSATGNCPFNVGDTSGIGWNAPVTGSPGNLVFSAQNGSETISFSGALNGGVIVGTVTFTHMLQTSTTTSTGATSVSVTLR